MFGQSTMPVGKLGPREQGQLAHCAPGAAGVEGLAQLICTDVTTVLAVPFGHAAWAQFPNSLCYSPICIVPVEIGTVTYYFWLYFIHKYAKYISVV